MVNYLNKFSKRLAEISGPIYAITGTSDFVWGPDQDQAFKDIKEEISKAPVLCAFDIHSQHRVSADSSRVALGAVLLQCNSEKEWQPVEFASRKLTEAEQNYAMIELEALGITWACEKFDFYLVGRSFEVETDHKPLISLLGEKDLSQLPLRVQRFKLRLMRYEFSIFHSPGRCMFIADYLSRPSSIEFLDRDVIECRIVEMFVASCLNEMLQDGVQEEEIICEISKDPVCLDLIEFIRSDWPQEISCLDPELQRLYKVRDSLTTYGDIILYNTRFYIPKSLRGKYLELCHEGHQGIVKCQRRARQLFWWPGCSSDIDELISKCDICTKFRKYKHQPLAEPCLPDGPWVELGSDILDFKGQLYLLVVDYYTRWIEIRALCSMSRSEVIQEFKTIFSTCDNAGCYTSQAFQEFARIWGFSQTFSSPRYPQSNGMAEKAVGTFKSLCFKSDDISAALLAYRAAPMSEGYSPGELMFGRPLRTPLGKPLDVHVDYKEFERVCIEQKERQIERWNKKFNAKYLPELSKGQIVWVKAPTDRGFKAVVVEKDKHPESYWVKAGNSSFRRNRKHLFLLQQLHDESDGEDGILPLQLDSWGDHGNKSRDLTPASELTRSEIPVTNNSDDSGGLASNSSDDGDLNTNDEINNRGSGETSGETQDNPQSDFESDSETNIEIQENSQSDLEPDLVFLEQPLTEAAETQSQSGQENGSKQVVKPKSRKKSKLNSEPDTEPRSPIRSYSKAGRKHKPKRDSVYFYPKD